jgi:hypothetical protein
MTTPAAITQGDLGTNPALAPAASHEFQDYQPPANRGHTAFMFRTTQVGTLVISRVSPIYGVKRVRSLTITDPTDEVLVRIDTAGLGTYRVTFTNTAGVNAVVSLEATWGT